MTVFLLIHASPDLSFIWKNDELHVYFIFQIHVESEEIPRWICKLIHHHLGNQNQILRQIKEDLHNTFYQNTQNITFRLK